MMLLSEAASTISLPARLNQAAASSFVRLLLTIRISGAASTANKKKSGAREIVYCTSAIQVA
jgi:hypothetical protein